MYNTVLYSNNRKALTLLYAVQDEKRDKLGATTSGDGSGTVTCLYSKTNFGGKQNIQKQIDEGESAGRARGKGPEFTSGEATGRVSEARGLTAPYTTLTP